MTLIEGKSLVARWALNMELKVEDRDKLCKNIFYTRCIVKDRICNMIIDSRSCMNVVSIELVEKLGLAFTKHPKPCKLKWLNNTGDVKVTCQCKVPFTIGIYNDEVECDIAIDRQVSHDGYKNRYSFI